MIVIGVRRRSVSGTCIFSYVINYELFNMFNMLQSHSGRLHAPCKRETKVLVCSNQTWSSTGIFPAHHLLRWEGNCAPVGRRDYPMLKRNREHTLKNLCGWVISSEWNTQPLVPRTRAPGMPLFTSHFNLITDK